MKKKEYQSKNTIGERFNNGQLSTLKKSTEEQDKINRKRAGQLFGKLSRTLQDRKVKFKMEEKRLISLVIEDVVYMPMIYQNNMHLFKAEEQGNRYKNLIDAEEFFPGIND